MKQGFYDLLVEDDKRFAAHMADVGVIPGVEFGIRLRKNAQPFYTRQYRIRTKMDGGPGGGGGFILKNFFLGVGSI